MKRDKWIQIPSSVKELENAKKLASEYDMSMAALVRGLLKYAEQYRPQIVNVATPTPKRKGG